MSEIEDVMDTEFDQLLQQVYLTELDVVDSQINERLNMSKELLGIVSDPADDIFILICIFLKTGPSLTHVSQKQNIDRQRKNGAR